MQLALPPEVLVPLVAGGVLLAVALIVVALLVRRRRRRRAATADTPTAPLTVGQVVHASGPADRPAPATDPAAPADVVPPTAPDDGAVPSAPGSPEVAAPGRPEGEWREPVARAEHAGSGRTVAAAVAQAFAAREARADGSVRGDARDRLLAVLLDDPVRAVGAAVELEACRRQLDRLSDAVRHERSALSDALGRLSAAGLAPDQVARLSGLPADELARLLPSPSTSG